MKVEYYSYYNIDKYHPRGKRPYISISYIRNRLPDEVNSELLPTMHPQNSIKVETKKTEIVNYLDKVILLQNENFDRLHYIEVTKDEINNYDYFYIDVRTLDWKKHIDYQVTKPTCSNSGKICPVGAERTTPTRIYSRYTRNLDIGRIMDIYSLEVRFVISERLKNIFDKEAVTGLIYEPCLVDSSNSCQAEEVHRGNLYIATVEFGIPQHASDIFPRSWCQEHHIIVSFDKCNLITRRKDVLDYDFQKLDRLIAKGQEYYYINPWWFISRKVLKILLENKVVGLKRYGIYLKQKFEPVVFD